MMKDKERKVPEQENNNVDIDINTDENQGGTTHLNDPLLDQSETDKLRAELEEQKDKFLRQAAEFDNFRKRNARERIELIQTAGKDVITDLLVVLDDAERAQKQLENSDDSQETKDGVMLVFNKLKNILYSKGLKPMESLHTAFDADIHEAITQIPAPSDDLKGRVVDVLQEGYYLNDRIIRYAKVVVGK
ncbi:MAG TPA: nucleotide exchange factor GrpE [Chitinophagaceae bacterium]|jgi:Molecular chaperone GrpE (heat shock protein)